MMFVPASYKRSSLDKLAQKGESSVEEAGGKNAPSEYFNTIQPVLPKSLYHNKVDMKMEISSAVEAWDLPHQGQNVDIMFLNKVQLAVQGALRSVIRSGGNALMFGGHSSGKTFLIRALLEELQQNCPTPSGMRQDLVSNLKALICKNDHKAKDEDQSGSIPNTLNRLCSVLDGIRSSFKNDRSSVNDDSTSFSHYWKDVVGVDDFANGYGSSYWNNREVRSHFKDNSVYSTTVSLNSVNTADKFRSWIAKEFKSEVPNTLEAPCYTFGVVFIDDIHLSNDTFKEVNLTNSVENLLKGILSNTPIFGTALGASNKLSAGVKAQSIPKEVVSLKTPVLHPTLHRGYQSDPRSSALNCSSQLAMDNFVMQPLSVIAAATGDYESLISKSDGANPSMFCSNLPYMCSVSVLAPDIHDIHSSLLISSYASLVRGSMGAEMENVTIAFDESKIEALKPKIVQLCKYTMNIINDMCKILVIHNSNSNLHAERNTHLMHTAIERSITLANVPSYLTVTKICKYMYAGGSGINSAIDLLSLWTHEWQRLFLDPFPEESRQRLKLVNSIKCQLDDIDVASWGITGDSIRQLTGLLYGLQSKIWLNTGLIQTLSINNGAYRPIELDLNKTADYLLKGTWDPDREQYREEVKASHVKPISAPEFGNFNINTILYPQAIALLLRLVRILSSVEGSGYKANNILLMGFPGTTRKLAVHLAAKICNLQLLVFDVKANMGAISEHLPSERTVRSKNLELFLKEAVWKVSGFSYSVVQKDSDEQPNIVLCTPSKIVLMITGITALLEKDRRLLVSILQYGDIPATMFTDLEWAGMMECLRITHR